MSDVQWAYQKSGAPAGEGVIMDFTDRLAPCPECGSDAYIWASPDGMMQVRYRCGHEPARYEDDDDG